jgi:hypothetical protein
MLNRVYAVGLAPIISDCFGKREIGTHDPHRHHRRYAGRVEVSGSRLAAPTP